MFLKCQVYLTQVRKIKIDFKLNLPPDVLFKIYVGT